MNYTVCDGCGEKIEDTDIHKSVSVALSLMSIKRGGARLNIDLHEKCAEGDKFVAMLIEANKPKTKVSRVIDDADDDDLDWEDEDD